MRKRIGVLAFALGIYGLSAGGGISVALAQGSAEEPVPPLPKAVFAGEAQNDVDEEPITDTAVPPLQVIPAPSEALDDVQSDTPADKREIVEDELDKTSGSARKMRDSRADSGEKNAPREQDALRSRRAGGGEKNAPREQDALRSNRADSGEETNEVKRDRSTVSERDNAENKKIKKASRRDPGTHKRQSVRGMEDVKESTAEEHADSEAKEQQPGDKRAVETTEAEAGGATDKGKEHTPERQLPRGTHAGSTVRGYVPSARPKSASVISEKQPDTSVSRRRVAPGQFGEPLESIVAEEMRSGK
ncbi:MAG: hypothetical protein Q4F00_01340 [bacterium]|nr:hypothetical protein [bacterium]